MYVPHGEEAANARRAIHAKPKPVGKACQIKSGFQSEPRMKPRLPRKAKAVKEPQSDGSTTADIPTLRGLTSGVGTKYKRAG